MRATRSSDVDREEEESLVGSESMEESLGYNGLLSSNKGGEAVVRCSKEEYY